MTTKEMQAMITIRTHVIFIAMVTGELISGCCVIKLERYYLIVKNIRYDEGCHFLIPQCHVKLIV